jgi:hypothetical protein
MNQLYRIATIMIIAAAAFAPVARAADVENPAIRVVGSVKLMAAPGDSIFAAKNHHHEYIYVAHTDKTVDVIDVSNPAAPRQLTGTEAARARKAGQAAVISVPESAATSTAHVLDISDPREPRVVAEFPNAISTTSDGRKLIYVLDQDSLRILTTQPEEHSSDDGWFRNAQTPG